MKTIYQSPEEAVAALNQHKINWYADPRRWPSDQYEWVLPVPDGDDITSLYRKTSPTDDWEWGDYDYLITHEIWPPDTAIFYDSDEESWHLATPSTDLPGAWDIVGTSIQVMDSETFPEELLPTRTPATAEEMRLTIQSVVQAATLHAQMMHLLADRGSR